MGTTLRRRYTAASPCQIWGRRIDDYHKAFELRFRYGRPVDDGDAMKGADSFKKDQARTHIAKSGYASVSAMKKDAIGVWRSAAMKDGHAVHVGLDFKGNQIGPARPSCGRSG